MNMTETGVAARPWWRSLLTRQDLRLVPAAGVCWLGTLFGVRFGWPYAVVVGILALLAGAGLLVGPRPPTRDGRVVAWSLVLCGLLIAALTGYRLGNDAANPLRAMAAHSASADLRVTIAEPPKPVSTPGFAGRQGGVRSVVIQADVHRVTVHGRTQDADGSVLLIAPVRGWSMLIRGQDVDAVGVLAAPQQGDTVVAVVRIRGSPRDVGQAPWWERTAEALRHGLRAASGGLSEDTRGLLPGLVTGDTSGVSPPVLDDFRTAGMAYLLAVGGYHFMIVCGSALWLLRRLSFGPKTCAVLTGMVLVGYLVIAGLKPSVLRACLMVGVGLVALATGRRRSTCSALAASIIVLVLWQPEFGGDLQFGLSVLATGAMLTLTRPLAEALVRRRVPAGIAELVAVGMVATLVTAPLIAAAYGEFSVVAIGANVLAEPGFVVAMVFGALAMACAPIAPPVAGFVARLAQPGLDWLLWVAHHGARLPAASVPWPTGWLGGLGLAALIAVLAVAMCWRRLRTLMLAILVGIVLVLVPVRVVAPGWPPAGWAMVDCDVGQGDGEVLATSEPGRAIVVDTGPDEVAIDECLTRLGVSRVPMVLLSHLHADHAGGLAAVLRGRSVGAVAVGPSRVPAWSWTNVRKETTAARVPLVEVGVGEHFAWPGLAMDVIGPPATESWPGGDDPSGTVVNNASLVIKASTTAGTVLLTGDVELASQADLLNAHLDLTADILKIPHHGSRYSSPSFLDAVHARVAVASVGQGNPYGHPSPLTLDRLRKDGALVMRTDQDGDVAVVPGRTGPTLVRRGSPRPPPHGSKQRPAAAGELPRSRRTRPVA
jgi:competence protein ComEC